MVAGQGVGAVSRFLAVARFAHEKQAAGAVGLDTGLDVAKEGLACGAGDFAAVQDEGVLGAEV